MVPQKTSEATSEQRHGAVAEDQESREKQVEFMDRLARKVVDWGMAIPAIFMLESSRPLSFVGSQVLVFFRPIVDSLFAFRSYDAFAEMLDDRRNIDYLLTKIEELESARIKEEKKERDTKPRRNLQFWKRS
jgi:hypothetical protein